MYLLLKGKLLDSLPPSARKGAEARNMMAASGKLQVTAASPGTARHTSHVTRHTSHVTRHTLRASPGALTPGALSDTLCGKRAM